MDEYIKRANAIEAVRHAWAKGLEPAQYLETILADDVAPVRHGRWNDSLARITPYCSACGHSHRCLIRTPNYCPNCGAKMDGELNE